MVLGSSSGMLSLLTWNRRDASFASTLSPSLGRSGCLRDVPGQYIAADPRGRCVFAGQCRAVLSLQLSSCCTCLSDGTQAFGGRWVLQLFCRRIAAPLSLLLSAVKYDGEFPLMCRVSLIAAQGRWIASVSQC